MKKKISVAVLSHNYGRYLSHCLSSLLEQTRKPDQIFVVDDASSSLDNTKEVAKKFGVPYFRVEFKNANKTRNYALKKMVGDYLLFMDADDWLHEDMLKKLAKILDEDKEHRIGVAYGSMWEVKDDAIYWERLYQRNLNVLNKMATPCMLFRREVFKKVKWDEELHHLQDWDMALQVQNAGWELVYEPTAYFFHRVHENSITHTSKKYWDEDYRRIAEKHFRILIFTPFSGKKEVLPHWLKGFDELDFDKKRLSFVWWDNSNDDEFSKTLLKELRKRAPQYDRAIYYKDTTPHIKSRGGDPAVAQRTAGIYNHIPIFLENEALVLIWEDDNIPPKDGLKKLMKRIKQHGQSAVAGWYYSHVTNPPMPVVWDMETAYIPGQGTHVRITRYKQPNPAKNCHPVLATGFGFFLIKRLWLEKVPFRGTSVLGMNKIWGSDIALGYDLFQQGEPVWVDWTVHVEHLQKVDKKKK